MQSTNLHQQSEDCMNVCMVSYSFYVMDSRVRQYANALTRRGDTVDVISLFHEGSSDVEVIDGVTVHRIMGRKRDETSKLTYLCRILQFMLHACILVARLNAKKRYDLVHVHSVPDFIVFVALVPKLTGAKIILDIHDILPEFYASKFGAQTLPMFRTLAMVEKLSCRFADHVIIANHIWYDRITKRSVEPERCTVICNYPDPRVFHPFAAQAKSSKFLIIYPGSLNAHQGLDIGIRAFARVAESMPNAEFHIYGDGPSKPELIALVQQLKMQDRVRFFAPVPYTEIAHVMATADLAVVCKRVSSDFGNEAASTKILEFMAIGVPVVAPRTKVDTLYFNDALVCFFRPEDEEDLARCLYDLYSHPELRERLVENSRQHVTTQNWDVKKQDYLDLVDRLVLGARDPNRGCADPGRTHGTQG
jgi:glycosyltransferase involved in cell wall biosynthesis